MRKMLASVILVAPLGIAYQVLAHDYPLKPVRAITSAPRGSSDFVARLVAQGISSPLGQQVIRDANIRDEN